MEIIDNLRQLNAERERLINTTLNNRTAEQYDRLAELNVAIAYEASKMQLKYQFQYEIMEKAKNFWQILSKMKRESRAIFDQFGLPVSKLEEYFTDNANQRFYVKNVFWNNWIAEAADTYPALKKAEVVAFLHQLDVRSIEFERLVGLSPSQYHNVYLQQIKVGMKQTDEMRSKAILPNLRLAMAIATKVYRDKQGVSQNVVDYNDIKMSAIEGLILALEKFEHKRGYKVSTYVTWEARQKASRFIDENRHIIKNMSDKEIYKEIRNIDSKYELRYNQKAPQKYLVLKCLLNEYIQLNKGIKNILPVEFIEANHAKVKHLVDMYADGITSTISEHELYVLDLLCNEQKNQMKAKQKQRNKTKINDKHEFIDEKTEFHLNKEELVWSYMLDLYEDTIGLDVFMDTQYFKEQFASLNDFSDEVDDNGNVVRKKKKSNAKDTRMKRINRVFHYSQPVVSLENEVGDEDNNTYRDTIKSDDPSIEEDLVEREYQLNMKKVLRDTLEKYLKPREATVITLYYGLGMQAPQDLKTIAAHLDVSPERVRQIEKSVLKKMQSIPELQELFKGLIEG